jgi:hypothetical protein
MTAERPTSTELPKFRQTNPHGFYYEDTLWPEGTEFYFTDTPNEFMEPLNEPARIALNAYLDKLDEEARKLAEKMGRPFYGRPREFADQVDLIRQDAQQIRDEKDRAATSKMQPVKRAPVPVQGHLAKKARPPSKMTGAKVPAPQPSPEAKPIAILGKNFEEMLPNNR